MSSGSGPTGRPPAPIRAWLAGAAQRAGDGRLTPGDIAAASCSFVAMGGWSPAVVRLADATEDEYGVIVDLTRDALQFVAPERLRRNGWREQPVRGIVVL